MFRYLLKSRISFNNRGTKCLFITLDKLHSNFFNDMRAYSSEKVYNKLQLEDSSLPWESSPLLATDVKPESYSLFLNPNIEEGTFSGRVSIALDVTQKRNNLYLHTKELKITSTKVLNPSKNETVPVKDSFEYEPNEFWVVNLESDILPGRYLLNLEFNGSLVDKIVGFYRSRYISPDNTTRYIVTTKFEPTYARRAFPCFDEPAYKAVFRVELVRPSDGGYIALSNMNQTDEEVDSPHQGVTKVTFAPTPPMSTYLACFIVCDFEKLDAGVSQTGTLINVYARPGQIQNMLYTRDLAVASINYYRNYFNLDYPLPKLDLIAIPDFVSGAMENWGLITFRETSVLIAEGVSSFNDYWLVSSTVCHELAHMWFGDIVTMAWWDDLWLNEGFATFMAAKCGQKIKPELNFELMEILRSMNPVLNEDAIITSHPIIQKVSHPDQITEIFDSISYHKGCAVLKMLEDLSPSSFREALNSYLTQFKYGNAKTEDLWASIQETMMNMNVSKVMDTWTKQAGYPVVEISRQGKNRLVLKQERFLNQKGTSYNISESPFEFKWDIPIVYFSSTDPRKIENLLFDMNKDYVTIDLPEGTNWFKMNWRQVGFYRVNYPLDNWHELINLLKKNPKALSWVEDRTNLIEDAFSLAGAGYIKYDIPLSLIGYLQTNEEKHFSPWMVTSKHLTFLHTMLTGSRVEEAFLAFARKLLEPVISDTAWDITSKTPTNEMLHKVSLITIGCNLKVPSVIEKAREMLQDYLDGAAEKPFIEIRSLVYKHGITGDKESSKWEKMWQIYLNERAPQELNKLRAALTNAENPDTLKRFLELAKNETYVRGQDYITLLILMSQHPAGNKVIWEFIRNEWEYLVKRFTLNDRPLGRLVPAVVKDFSTEEQLHEVKSFFSKYPDAGAGAAGRKSAIENIQNNIKWSEKHLNEIELWLKDNS